MKTLILRRSNSAVVVIKRKLPKVVSPSMRKEQVVTKLMILDG